MIVDADLKYMNRAFELALKGAGRVSPNPMVGCVIVHQGRIIGEGWHQQYGGSHAEVNAINSVDDKSLLSNSTAYVTLEPCAHFGKTPPCADLLVKHRLKRVVISNKDPFELVDGSGIQKLEREGIEVSLAVGQESGTAINKRFFTYHQKKRPYIILKWAQTADGFVARENFDSKWISNAYSRKLVHKWRSEEDAILVGTSTARYDNPSLTTRDWIGKNPLRLVIDKNLKLDASLHLFDGSTPTICYNLHRTDKTNNIEWIKVGREDLIGDLLKDLYQRKVQSLFVEGGSKLLQSFIEQNIWDEARVFSANTSFGSGIPAPNISGQISSQQYVGSDLLKIWNR